MGRIKIEIPNVRIFSTEGVYSIDSISAFDLEGSKDTENNLFVSSESELNLVLVLDYSTSLGNDLTTLKKEAIVFSNRLLKARSGANGVNNTKIGCVIFSRSIETLAPTADSNMISNFINAERVRSDETKLFESIDKGIDLLKSSNAQSLVLITFTDGTNNSQCCPEFETSDFVINKLNRTVIGSFNQKIQSYTIGYTGKGNFTETELRSLAVNGGRFAKGSDIQSVFTRTYNRITSNYNLVYDRNDSQVTIPKRVTFKFYCRLIPGTED